MTPESPTAQSEPSDRAIAQAFREAVQADKAAGYPNNDYAAIEHRASELDETTPPAGARDAVGEVCASGCDIHEAVSFFVESLPIGTKLYTQPAPVVGGVIGEVTGSEYGASNRYVKVKFALHGAASPLEFPIGKQVRIALLAARPAESVAQGGEALFLAVASKLDHGPGELDPNATETIHTAQCRCGLFVQIATPAPATGSGGEAVATVVGFDRGLPDLDWTLSRPLAKGDKLYTNPAPAGGGAGDSA